MADNNHILIYGTLLAVVLLTYSVAFFYNTGNITGFVVGEQIQPLQNVNAEQGETITFDIAKNFDQESDFYDFRGSNGYEFTVDDNIVNVTPTQSGTWSMTAFARINGTLEQTDEYYLNVTSTSNQPTSELSQNQSNTSEPTQNTTQPNTTESNTTENDTALTQQPLTLTGKTTAIANGTDPINLTLQTTNNITLDVTTDGANLTGLPETISPPQPITFTSPQPQQATLTVESQQTNQATTTQYTFTTDDATPSQDTTQNQTCNDNQCNLNGQCINQGTTINGQECTQHGVFTEQRFQIQDDNTLMIIDQNGDLWTNQDVIENCNQDPTTTQDYYEVRDEQRLFWLDQNGQLCLTGNLFQQQSNIERICSDQSCYKIGDDPTMAVTANGDMYIQGTLR